MLIIVLSPMARHFVIKPYFFLLAIFDDVYSVLPSKKFMGDREPKFSDGILMQKVSDIVFPSLSAFWRNDKASVDSVIFKKWVRAIIRPSLAHV